MSLLEVFIYEGLVKNGTISPDDENPDGDIGSTINSLGGDQNDQPRGRDT